MKHSLIALALGFSTTLSHASVTRFSPLDVNALFQTELSISRKGEAPHFAVPHKVKISPLNSNEWVREGSQMVWHHRVIAPNAVSLNFGFTLFKLPVGATLSIASTDGALRIRDFTAKDNNVNNQLWTPILATDDVTIELRVPADKMDSLSFELGQIGQGFRNFSDRASLDSGTCNIDVACTESKGWEKEVGSVAMISRDGSGFCTGFMVNNTRKDSTPYFMTAFHCSVTETSAPSLVVYWNFEASKCGGVRDGRTDQFQTGATFLAASSKSDFTLVKLNTTPDTEWSVHFSGWNHADAPSKSSVGIHHPNVDEKAISFDADASQINSYLGKTDGPGDRTHIRIVDWDKGTTEPGSSGSPLFDEKHRVIGQLHGGWAACDNDESDYYGRFATSWDGEGSKGKRLKDYLDPDNKGTLTLDTL